MIVLRSASRRHLIALICAFLGFAAVMAATLSETSALTTVEYTEAELDYIDSVQEALYALKPAVSYEDVSEEATGHKETFIRNMTNRAAWYCGGEYLLKNDPEIDRENQCFRFTYKENAAEMKAEMNRSIRKAIRSTREAETRAKKIKAVYDWLIQNCSYDYAEYRSVKSVHPDAYTAYGALVKHRAVCQGYASAFKVIMTRLGIKCDFVVSDFHGWNRVKLGGKWYNVDVTYGDPDNINKLPDSSYFLLSDRRLNALDKAAKDDSHKAKCGLFYNVSCTETKFDHKKNWPCYPLLKKGETFRFEGAEYRLLSDRTCTLVKAPKNKKYFTLADTVNCRGHNIHTAGISPYAFRGTKTVKLTIDTRKLTRRSVRKSLKRSRVKSIDIAAGNGLKYYDKYRPYFSRKNCGKKVEIW